MLNVILTLTGIILGIAATALVGRYYFRRTVERELTPFVHLHSLVLAGIDSDYRKDLKILFHDEPVEDLTHLQLLIANTGTRAIRDCIQPLTIFFPKKVSVMEYAILHKNPNELQVRLARQKKDEGKQESVQVEFPLLNRGDFFLLKFLLKGAVKPFDVECRITVDDLPPKLRVEWLPPSATKKEKAAIEWSAFWVGLGVTAAAAGFVYMLFLLWHAKPSIFPFPWETYEFSVINTIALVLSVVTVLIFVLIGILLMTGIAFDEVFSKPKHKFPLPDGLQPSYRFQPSRRKIERADSDDKENKESSNNTIDSDEE